MLFRQVRSLIGLLLSIYVLDYLPKVQSFDVEIRQMNGNPFGAIFGDLFNELELGKPGSRGAMNGETVEIEISPAGRRETRRRYRNGVESVEVIQMNGPGLFKGNLKHGKPGAINPFMIMTQMDQMMEDIISNMLIDINKHEHIDWDDSQDDRESDTGRDTKEKIQKEQAQLEADNLELEEEEISQKPQISEEITDEKFAEEVEIGKPSAGQSNQVDLDGIKIKDTGRKMHPEHKDM